MALNITLLFVEITKHCLGIVPKLRSSRPTVFCKKGVLRNFAKLFLEISQISQENTCARVSVLVMLQALGLQLW